MKIQDFKLSILSLSHYASANHEDFEQQLFCIIQSLCMFCGFMATFIFALLKLPQMLKLLKKLYFLLLKQIQNSTILI